MADLIWISRFMLKKYQTKKYNKNVCLSVCVLAPLLLTGLPSDLDLHTDIPFHAGPLKAFFQLNKFNIVYKMY